MENIRQYISTYYPEGVVALAAKYNQQIANDYNSCFNFLTGFMQYNENLAQSEMNAILPIAVVNREKAQITPPPAKTECSCGCGSSSSCGRKKFKNTTGSDESSDSDIMTQISTQIESKFNHLKDIYQSRPDSDKKLINMAAAFLAGMFVAHIFIKK